MAVYWRMKNDKFGVNEDQRESGEVSGFPGCQTYFSILAFTSADFSFTEFAANDFNRQVLVTSTSLAS